MMISLDQLVSLIGARYRGGNVSTYALLCNILGSGENRYFSLALRFLKESVEGGLVDVADEELVVGVDFGVDVCAHSEAHRS